jgi:hypothetical protein
MFCDQCGAELQSGAPRCGRCGKTVLGLIELRRSRVREHVRLLGILWVAYAAFHVFAGALVMVLAKTIFHIHVHNGPPPGAAIWLQPFLTGIAWVILVKAAACFIAGWGLLQREDWREPLRW